MYSYLLNPHQISCQIAMLLAEQSGSDWNDELLRVRVSLECNALDGNHFAISINGKFVEPIRPDQATLGEHYNFESFTENHLRPRVLQFSAAQ